MYVIYALYVCVTKPGFLNQPFLLFSLIVGTNNDILKTGVMNHSVSMKGSAKGRTTTTHANDKRRAALGGDFHARRSYHKIFLSPWLPSL